MIIIYNKDKQKVQGLVDKILQEHPEYGEVTVIGDLSELPEDVVEKKRLTSIIYRRFQILKNLSKKTRPSFKNYPVSTGKRKIRPVRNSNIKH